MENVNLRFGIYLLVVPILLFQVLSITGCTSVSPGVPNIFLVEAQGNDLLSETNVRIGYLGICAHTGNTTICQASVGKNATLLQSSLGLGPEMNSVLYFASTLQSKIFLLMPAVSGLFFFLGLVSFILVKRYQKQSTPNANAAARQQSFKRYTLGFVWAAVGFSLASAVGLAQAISGMTVFSDMSEEAQIPFDIVPGTTLQALQWCTLSFIGLFALGISVMMHDAAAVKAKTKKSTAATAKPTTTKKKKATTTEKV